MRPFYDEDGMTSVGMVLALLVALSLIFSSAQVYRVQSASSAVQNVADAAALAAQNEVAEFMVVVRTCDAVALSLSLTSLTATGLGIAALCTPATAPASETLLAAGKDIARARDAFAEKASSGLDRLQKLLPFLAAANAASVASANDGASSRYVALAVLAPAEGEPVSVPPADEATRVQQAAEAEADDIREAAARAEQAAERANEAKAEAFEHDCGANPSYCMYERASSLAGMAGADNPLFRSQDAWSFSVALERAQAYYPARLAAEEPQGSSVEERARSALRTRFYAYAAREVQRGYVREDGDSFQAFFPHLPKNTAEMRRTSLYTDAVYPCTENDEGKPVMHAWDGCPRAAGAASRGSIAQMEAGSYAECEACGFSASSLGKVAAASSSIENGFEYHYEAVAAAADAYQAARAELDPLTCQVKERAGGLFDQVREALGAAADARVDACPPGSLGVAVLAANTAQTPASAGFASSFVQGSGSLGPRAAVSAATLLADPADDAGSAVASLLDGVSDGGAATGAAGAVLQCWSSLLQAYASGQDALRRAVSSALDGLPLLGESGLGSWASDALRDATDAAGLEPAELDALKPVIVNSAHVAAADDSAFSVRLLSAKSQAVAHPLESNDLFSSLVGAVEQEAVDGVQSLGAKVELASIELLGGGGPRVTIEVALPPAVRDAGVDVVHQAADAVRSVYAQVTGVRVWE